MLLVKSFVAWQLNSHSFALRSSARLENVLQRLCVDWQHGCLPASCAFSVCACWDFCLSSQCVVLQFVHMYHDIIMR